MAVSFAHISCHALDDRASHASCAEPSRALEVCAVGNTACIASDRRLHTLRPMIRVIQSSLALWLDNSRCILVGSSCGRGRILWKATVC